MISDFEAYGGAAIAAIRLADGLAAGGLEVHRIVAQADQTHARRHQTIPIGYRHRYRHLAHYATLGHGERALRPLTHLRLARALAKAKPDVISLHNIHSAWNAGWSSRLITECTAVAPVAWTLHDMWSFTGRCAYSEQCRLFEEKCTPQCPTPTEYPALKPRQIPLEYGVRQREFRSNPDVVAVSPSRWLADEARRGMWQSHRVEIIPNGIDLDIYYPIDRADARRQLGLPSNGLILLAAALDLNDRRKGSDLLAGALERVTTPLTLLTLGDGGIPSVPQDVSLVPLGRVDDDWSKACVFSAADLYLHAARADNFPLVVQESLACGTPVAALPVGGLPEMIDSGRTGVLADAVTPDALGAAIELAIEAGMARNTCRAYAEANWSLDVQSARYADLFKDMTRSEG